MSRLRRAAAPTQAEVDTLRAEAAHNRAEAHNQVAAAHIPVHQAAAGSRADTVRH